jgi:hypothetical protein
MRQRWHPVLSILILVDSKVLYDKLLRRTQWQVRFSPDFGDVQLGAIGCRSLEKNNACSTQIDEYVSRSLRLPAIALPADKSIRAWESTPLKINGTSRTCRWRIRFCANLWEITLKFQSRVAR